MEQSCTLVGEDGSPVLGVQMGVNAACRVHLKYFAQGFNYLEIYLDRSWPAAVPFQSSFNVNQRRFRSAYVTGKVAPGTARDPSWQSAI